MISSPKTTKLSVSGLAISYEITRISGLKPADVPLQWQSRFGRVPPKELSRDQLVRQIAGPGSLSAIVLLMGRVDGWNNSLAIIAMLTLCLALTFVTMLIADRLLEWLGKTGADVVGRIGRASGGTGRPIRS